MGDNRNAKRLAAWTVATVINSTLKQGQLSGALFSLNAQLHRELRPFDWRKLRSSHKALTLSRTTLRNIADIGCLLSKLWAGCHLLRKKIGL